jgi:hypothetical protein
MNCKAGASPAENELATGAVALQPVIVQKVYARAGYFSRLRPLRENPVTS